MLGEDKSDQKPWQHTRTTERCMEDRQNNTRKNSENIWRKKKIFKTIETSWVIVLFEWQIYFTVVTFSICWTSEKKYNFNVYVFVPVDLSLFFCCECCDLCAWMSVLCIATLPDCFGSRKLTMPKTSHMHLSH